MSTDEQETRTTVTGWVVAFVVLFGAQWLINLEGGPARAAIRALMVLLFWLGVAWLWNTTTKGSTARRARSYPSQGDPAAAKATLPHPDDRLLPQRPTPSALKPPPAKFPDDLVIGGAPEALRESRAHRARVREAILDGHPAEFSLDGAVYDADVVPLGTLRVPTGVIGAADPFVGLTTPLRVHVPPGTYPVNIVTLARLDGAGVTEAENAYLTVRIADGERALVRPVADDEGRRIGVRSSTVAFVDADAVPDAMPEDEDSWEESPYGLGDGSGWFDWLDDADAVHPTRDNTVRRPGMLNVTMPRARHGENVVMASAGGDGTYACLVSRDAGGQVLDVTIDLGVIDIWD